MDEVGLGAEVERGDGALFEEELLGLLEEFVALLLVWGGRCGGQQFVVRGIFPAGPVVGTVGTEESKEGNGIGEICGPRGGGDRIVERLLILNPGFLFHLHEGNVDAEFALPRSLHGFGETGHQLVVARLEFDGGQTSAVGETGFGEESACGFKIQADGSVGGVATGAGRREGVGGLSAGLENGAGERVAVDGEREGAADFRIIEGRLRGVEAEKHGLQERIEAEFGGILLSPRGDFGNGQGEGDVELAGAEGALFSVGILDGKEGDLLELRGGGFPVVRVFLDEDADVGRPFFEGERAVADEVAGARPGGAAFFHAAEFCNGARIEREPRGERDERGQIRRGLSEGDDDHAGVGRGEAEGGGIGEFAGVVGFRVFHGVKIRGVVGGECGVERATPGIDEILREERFAVGPLKAGAEMENPGEAVGGSFPMFSGGGDGEGGLFVEGGQAFEECHENILIAENGRGLRIEVRGFGAIAHEESLGADTGIDGRFAAGAGGEGEEEGKAEGLKS